MAAWLIARSAARPVTSSANSPLARADLLIIRENLRKLARGTIEAEFPSKHHIDELEGRTNWLRAFSFLAMTELFPGRGF